MRQKPVIKNVLKSVTKSYHKVRKVLQIVTKVYYKVPQVLQSATGCYYEVRQVFTKCDSYCKARLIKDMLLNLHPVQLTKSLLFSAILNISTLD